MKKVIKNGALPLFVLLLITGFILFVGNYLQAQVVDEYLQADFKFIDGSLNDDSPNMIDGTGYNLSSAVGWDGVTNSAYTFNGSSSYIDCTADSRNITDQITISAWIRANTARRQIMVSKYEMDADAGVSLGMLDDGSVSLEGRDGSNTFHVINSGGYPITDNKWHHIVGVIDQNQWKLYVDCYLLAELNTETVSPQFINSRPLTIGKLSEPNNLGQSRFFQGQIDDVKIYNYPLSEDQLGEVSPPNCTGIPDLLTGLVAYYPLDGDATDLSGNDLHGSLNGTSPVANRFDVGNSALQFNGIDDYIVVNDNPLLNFGTGPFAVCLWVKALDPEGGPQMLVHKGISGQGGQYWLRENEYDEITRLGALITEGDPPGSFLSVTDPIFDDQEWHHLVFQRTYFALEIWVDGEMKIQLPDMQYRNVDNTGNFMIGAQNAWSEGGNYPYVHNYFNGLIDEVRLYNRPLLPEDIVAVANTYCPAELVISADPEFDLYQAENILSTSGTITVNGSTIFKAGSLVQLNPGFHAVAGSEFLAKIEDCIPAEPASTPVIPEPGSAFATNLRNAESSISMQVAPNPVRSNIRILLQLDEPTHANLQVLDMTGRIVQELLHGRELDKGSQTLNADLSHLPAGMYLLSLRTEEAAVTKKIIKNQE
ncbi:MAG: LamG-like jellyroll fold domain-containing protein [Saprospiraceae bacterium]|nr:T9SS type A sorting domain-containing protein [Lewinella sp.]